MHEIQLEPDVHPDPCTKYMHASGGALDVHPDPETPPNNLPDILAKPAVRRNYLWVDAQAFSLVSK